MPINTSMNNLPFLTHVQHKEHDFLCLILNSDDKILTFYDLSKIESEDITECLMELGEVWWSESNRLLPINIFMRENMKPFRKYLRTVNRKDITIIDGPCTSLNNLIRKRVKKRQITLVKRTR